MIKESYQKASYIEKIIINVTENPINIVTDGDILYHSTTVNEIFSATKEEYLHNEEVKKTPREALSDQLKGFLIKLDADYSQDIQSFEEEYRIQLTKFEDERKTAEKKYNVDVDAENANKDVIKEDYEKYLKQSEELTNKLKASYEEKKKKIINELKEKLNNNINTNERKVSFIKYFEDKEKKARNNADKNFLKYLGHIAMLTLKNIAFFVGIFANVISLAILAAIVVIRKTIHAISVVAYGKVNKDLDDLYQTAEQQPGYANRVGVYLAKTLDVARGVLTSSIMWVRSLFKNNSDLNNKKPIPPYKEVLKEYIDLIKEDIEEQERNGTYEKPQSRDLKIELVKLEQELVELEKKEIEAKESAEIEVNQQESDVVSDGFNTSGNNTKDSVQTDIKTLSL